MRTFPFRSWLSFCRNLVPFAPVKKPVERSQIHPWTYLSPSLNYRAWMTVILPPKVHRDTWSLDFWPSPQSLKRQRNTWYLDFDMLPPRVKSMWKVSSGLFKGCQCQLSLPICPPLLREHVLIPSTFSNSFFPGTLHSFLSVSLFANLGSFY